MPLLPKDMEIGLGLRMLSVVQFLYERSDGRIGGRMGGMRILLLRTRGRKTGALRTVALTYVEAGRGVAVIGSKGGSDSPPAWLLNVVDDPSPEVQVGRRRWRVRARIAEGAEHDRLWQAAVRVWPGYDAYQRRTERRIPVVVLDPV